MLCPWWCFYKPPRSAFLQHSSSRRTREVTGSTGRGKAGETLNPLTQPQQRLWELPLALMGYRDGVWCQLPRGPAGTLGDGASCFSFSVGVWLEKGRYDWKAFCCSTTHFWSRRRERRFSIKLVHQRLCIVLGWMSGKSKRQSGNLENLQEAHCHVIPHILRSLGSLPSSFCLWASSYACLLCPAQLQVGVWLWL